jgi:hypothetical protein
LVPACKRKNLGVKWARIANLGIDVKDVLFARDMRPDGKW